MLGLVVGIEYRKAIGFGNVDTGNTRYSRNAIMLVCGFISLVH